ncbi:hypothetical protein HK405_000715, partial [Cladochytrium tenue]
SAALRFPDGFLWGTATASYQVEGAADEGGRADSIWDVFARTPGRVANGDTGARAVDHYHRYKEDVALMKAMGVGAYRFSIAWPRILPGTGLQEQLEDDGPVNEEGVAFYDALINELLANGIQPVATLYHWDLPQALEDRVGGWLGGRAIQDAFTRYARVCFERFGDRVKSWITLNEPWCSALLGYGTGVHAPGRTVRPQRETYEAAHNLLLAHARAVKVYRNEFKAAQGGRIGITLNCDWRQAAAADDDARRAANEAAAERALLFSLGWFADPVYLGDYPAVMKARAGARLPAFSDDERVLVHGSSDFFGLNHYGTAYTEPTADYAEGVPGPDDDATGSFERDQGVVLTADPAWKRTDMGWNVVGWGFEKHLLWIQARYGAHVPSGSDGGILVTENGCAVPDRTKEEAENDDFRVDFYHEYLLAMQRAIARGADVRGYFAWSFCDNFEWAEGYNKRFGLHWVDYATMERTPKMSARFYGRVARDNAVPLAI